MPLPILAIAKGGIILLHQILEATLQQSAVPNLEVVLVLLIFLHFPANCLFKPILTL
jgi:hypothetical protein